MKKFIALLSVIASFGTAFAGLEWTSCSGGYENDLWTITASLNNGALALNGAVPKDGVLKTLDLSNFPGMTQFKAWGTNVPTVETLILPANITYIAIQGKMSSLKEVRTPDDDHPHVFSLSSTADNNGIIKGVPVEGDYVFNDITIFPQNYSFSETKINSLELNGTYSAIRGKIAFDTYDLRSLAFHTSGSVTAIPSNMCGHWGNQTSTGEFMLETLTLNDVPMLQSREITTVQAQAVPHCIHLADGIDLPNCTSIGDYAFRYGQSIPYVNLMNVQTVGNSAFQYLDSADRIVIGSSCTSISADAFSNSFGNIADPVVIWNMSTKPTLGGSCLFRDIADKVKVYVRKEANWLVENMTTAAPIVEHVGDNWYLRCWNNNTNGRQKLYEMDAVVKVNIRKDDQVLMTTLVPGMAGHDVEWSIPAKYFFGTGTTFGPGSVKNTSEQVIEGASAMPDQSGLHLEFSLPASMVPSVPGVTQDIEVNVDITTVTQTDHDVTVSVVDSDDNELFSFVSDVPYGESVSTNLLAEITSGGYYYNSVVSTTVEPQSAASSATFDLVGDLSVTEVSADAVVTVKINRQTRPAQQDHWTLANDKYSMTDGVWTFRCDFNGDNAVVADAVGYVGPYMDIAGVDMSKPITDGVDNYTLKRLDWGANINGAAITLNSNNHCGKDIVINGASGTARTLVGELVIPASVDYVAGWGYCENLTIDAADVSGIFDFGRFAFANTKISGTLNFGNNDVAVGYYAFMNCHQLTSVIIRGRGSHVDEGAFSNCQTLSTLDASGIDNIPYRAFGMENGTTRPLTQVTLSATVTNIAGTAFQYHSNAEFSYAGMDARRPPADVTCKIESYAFRDCFAESGCRHFTVPFLGPCTLTEQAFHFHYVTNYTFWGKAPLNGTLKTVFRDLPSKTADYAVSITCCKEIDQEGWEAQADILKSSMSAQDWEALNPPEDAFGIALIKKNANDDKVRFWLRWGKSPWARQGMVILIR